LKSLDNFQDAANSLQIFANFYLGDSFLIKILQAKKFGKLEWADSPEPPALSLKAAASAEGSDAEA
jgi:hypothetical protein